MENNKINIAPDERVCYNCKHRLWAVAIGLGVMCAKKEKGGMFAQVPGLRKSCDQFEMREENNRKIFSYGLKKSISQYISPEEKTIDQILNELIILQEEREDRVGAIMRIIRFQRGNTKLTEAQEQDLIDSKNLQIVIEEVQELKEWVIQESHKP